jgi:copper chaperone NosL
MIMSSPGATEQGAPVVSKQRDNHVHLAVTQEAAKPRWDWARWVVVLLGLSGVGFFVASFFKVWWQFWLYAPQYPKGLALDISLTGMSGDVHEIDLLNHYIGMKHLAGAAATERHLAGYGVAAIAIITIALFAIAGRKLNKLVAIPAIAFPVVFLIDSFYWLYTFGHHLDPKAPLHIGAFTPQMFGNGQIGQFETFASPAIGFWLAVGGVACALLATFLRSRVCAHCAQAGTCSAVCPRVMVLHPHEHGKDDAA